MVKVIGGAQEGEFKAVASGTLPNGKPVVVNADGTVSVAEETTQAVGTVATSSTPPNTTWVVFDSNSDKLVIIFGDTSNSDYLTTIVGTISGTSITFGTPVVISEGISPSADGYILAATFNSSANKIVLVYDPQSGNAVARVGTVSGTSISYGSTRDLGGNYNYFGICFDSSNNKVVIGYIDANGKGTAVVGTVSGTSISLGSPTQFNSSTGTANIVCVFDSTNNKVVIAYRDASSFSGDGSGSAIVGTVSGTSISFGSEVQFSSNNVHYVGASFDEENSKVVIVFCDLTASGNTNEGPPKAIVGTVSGTSISFGSLVTIDSANSRYTFVTYNPVAKKHLITWRDTTNNYGYYVEGTVSGTSIAFTTKASFSTADTYFVTSGSDPNSGICVIAYRDNTNTNLSARVYRFQTTNLTSENYIGMSSGAVIPSVNGTKTAFNSGAIGSEVTGSVYDPDTGKIIICYTRGSDNHGLAVVGTVSGTTLSFGTPVVFNAGVTDHTDITYDTANNKVLIVYKNTGNNNYGTAIVGTVSGTSISFGTPVVYFSARSHNNKATFDTNAGKSLVVWLDDDNNDVESAVATISGTSVSFGSTVTVDANANSNEVVFDSNSNKVVVVYKDLGNSNYGTAIVGTISGTSVSFGSEVVFNAGSTSDIHCAFDSTNNKVIISFKAGSDGDKAKAIVGTVSGTSISFGSLATINDSASQQPKPVYNSVLQELIFEYEISGNGLYYRTASVSGTSIVNIGSQVTLASGFDALVSNLVYHPTENVAVVGFKDSGDSNKGNAIAFSTEQRGEVASGGAATVDIIGSLSTNQGGLTAGQQYFVQTDGTIGTTADSPSVLAGTAISSSKLLVKT